MTPISTKDGLCPVCHGSGSTLVTGGKDYFVLGGASDDFEVRYCPHCEIGYSLPTLTAEELTHYYPQHYEAYHPKRSLAGYFQLLKYRDDLRTIRRSVGPTARMLFEIGAGRGEFLHTAKEQGCSVSGLEPSSVGVESAFKHYGIVLRQGAVEQSSALAEAYEVVVVRHVLEHVQDPVLCLRKIRETALKEGGLLFIKLPRLDSWEARSAGKYWIGYDLPRHRTHFTKEGIRKMLETCGFGHIRVRSEVVPVDVIRSLSYYALHGPDSARRRSARMLTALPGPIKVLLASIVVMVLAPWGAGRMVITARRS